MLNFLKRFQKGDPVCKVADTENMNRIANILEDLKGVGCRIVKPTNDNGRGWKIIIDPFNSDADPEDADEEPTTQLDFDFELFGDLQYSTSTHKMTATKYAIHVSRGMITSAVATTDFEIFEAVAETANS